MNWTLDIKLIAVVDLFVPKGTPTRGQGDKSTLLMNGHWWLICSALVGAALAANRGDKSTSLMNGYCDIKSTSLVGLFGPCRSCFSCEPRW